MCDGVAASILESLALGTPVVASENGTRPDGVVTYTNLDEDQMCTKLSLVVTQPEQVRQRIRLDEMEDNIDLTADWLLGQSGVRPPKCEAELAHVR